MLKPYYDGNSPKYFWHDLLKKYFENIASEKNNTANFVIDSIWSFRFLYLVIASTQIPRI